MNKSKELQTTTDLVKEVLELYPQTRNSDNELYYRVCLIISKRHGLDLHYITMPMFFMHMKEYGFPATETVRRCRQKLQATYPELSGDADVEAQRTLNEGIFRDYAKGCV